MVCNLMRSVGVAVGIVVDVVVAAAAELVVVELAVVSY